MKKPLDFIRISKNLTETRLKPSDPMNSAGSFTVLAGPVDFFVLGPPKGLAAVAGLDLPFGSTLTFFLKQFKYSG